MVNEKDEEFQGKKRRRLLGRQLKLYSLIGTV